MHLCLQPLSCQSEPSMLNMACKVPQKPRPMLLHGHAHCFICTRVAQRGACCHFHVCVKQRCAAYRQASAVILSGELSDGHLGDCEHLH